MNCLWKNLSWPWNLVGAVLGEYTSEEELKANSPSDILPSIMHVLGTLSGNTAQVIIMRFMLGKTLEEIGCSLGTTKERARQIEAKGLRWLRHPQKRKYIKRGIAEITRNELQKVRENAYRNGYITGRYDEAQSQFDEMPPLSDRLPSEVTVEELDLSVRSYNCLKRAGVEKLSDILDMTMSEVAALRNLGAKSLHEIMFVLKNLGYDLKEDTANS